MKNKNKPLWPAVRLHPDLHQSLKIRAAKERVTIQALVDRLLAGYRSRADRLLSSPRG